jgi:hypothetical protein
MPTPPEEKTFWEGDGPEPSQDEIVRAVDQAAKHPSIRAKSGLGAACSGATYGRLVELTESTLNAWRREEGIGPVPMRVEDKTAFPTSYKPSKTRDNIQNAARAKQLHMARGHIKKCRKQGTKRTGFTETNAAREALRCQNYALLEELLAHVASAEDNGQHKGYMGYLLAELHAGIFREKPSPWVGMSSSAKEKIQGLKIAEMILRHYSSKGLKDLLGSLRTEMKGGADVGGLEKTARKELLRRSLKKERPHPTREGEELTI